MRRAWTFLAASSALMWLAFAADIVVRWHQGAALDGADTVAAVMSICVMAIATFKFIRED